MCAREGLRGFFSPAYGDWKMEERELDEQQETRLEIRSILSIRLYWRMHISADLVLGFGEQLLGTVM